MLYTVCHADKIGETKVKLKIEVIADTPEDANEIFEDYWNNSLHPVEPTTPVQFALVSTDEDGHSHFEGTIENRTGRF